MTTDSRDFLVELGTEELPPKALRKLRDAFAAEIVNGLARAGLPHGTVRPLAAPRRLAVIVEAVGVTQLDRTVSMDGPPVKAAFDALDPRILPEMSAKVAFLSRTLKPEEEQSRLVVNPQALVERQGRLVAFVLKDQKVQAVPVQVGPKLGDWLEVLGGLQEGDKVVLQPPKNLASGDQVKVIEG